MKGKERTDCVTSTHDFKGPYLRKKSSIIPKDPDPVPVTLYARLKRTSKYYHQGLDQDNKPCVFAVDGIIPGSHPFRLNNNSYRRDDLVFFIKDQVGQLIKL